MEREDYARINSDISERFEGEVEDTRKKKLVPIVSRDDLAKKSLAKRILGLVLTDDIDDLKQYVIREIVMPNLKETILDIGETAMLGTSRDRDRDYQPYRDDYGRIRYDKIYGKKKKKKKYREREDYDDDYDEDERTEYRDIVLKKRQDAERIVAELRGQIDSCGQVSVAEFMDLLDLPNNFVDHSWGWIDRRDIGIRRVKTGWLIDVAKAIYLD